MVGDGYAAAEPAELLADQGRVDDAIRLLRTRADTGDVNASDQLAWLLLKQDRIDELWSEVHAGTPMASDRLLDLLAEHGEAEQAKELKRWGLSPDGSIATANDVAGRW